MWRLRPVVPVVRNAFPRRRLNTELTSTETTKIYTPQDPKEAELLNRFASKPYTPVSLQHMVVLGSSADKNALLQTAQFLHSEVPVRLAKIIQTLDSLPYGLSDTQAPVRGTRTQFMNTFKLFAELSRPVDQKDEQKFAALVKDVLLHHQHASDSVAQKSWDESVLNMPFDEKIVIQPFLDRLFMSRIGNRTILSQYTALHTPPTAEWVGILEKKCNVAGIVKDTVKAIHQCLGGESPEVIVKGNLEASITYIRDHLRYVLMELLTNAMTSTLRQHKQKPPPVLVVITETSSGLDLRVSDQGGGMNRSDIPAMWTHLGAAGLYDPERGSPAFRSFGLHSSDDHISSVMFGGQYRFGSLPLARLYCRYTGGDLRVFSMRSHGTDVYVSLRKGGDFSEPIGGPGFSARNKRMDGGQELPRDVWITD